MKKLKPLTISCIDEFEVIRLSKNSPTKDRLLLMKPHIENRYNEYDNKFNNNILELVAEQTYTNIESTDLLNCYNSSTQALSNLILRIKQNQDKNIKSVCQYCGIGTDDSTDHYLPKGKFPEYCVKQLNLIPCCQRCNQLKSEFWLDPTTNKRGVINLYLDDLPNDEYLFMDLTFNATEKIFKADFYLNNISSIDSDLFSIIKSHYNQLQLCTRYKDRFNTVYSQTVSSFDKLDIFENNPNLIKNFLLKESESLVEKFGVNYYKAIIKKGLANNDDFLNLF